MEPQKKIAITMTTIRYFVPEDGDTEEHPNIFLMPKSQNSGFSPRLREMKEHFPMPGSYHFRFKSPLIPGSDREKNAVSVWMDCVNDNQHVGVWRNTIVAKVTRINMEDDADFTRHRQQSRQNGTATAAPVAANTANNAPPKRPPVQHSSSKGRAAPPAPAPASAPVPTSASEDILGLDSNRHPPARNESLLDVPAARSSEGNLLNMGGPASYNASVNLQASASQDDFLGMMSTPVTSSAPAPVPVPTPAPAPTTPSSYNMQHSSSSNGMAQKPNKAFETFAQQSGPFGGLEWK